MDCPPCPAFSEESLVTTIKPILPPLRVQAVCGLDLILQAPCFDIALDILAGQCNPGADCAVWCGPILAVVRLADGTVVRFQRPSPKGTAHD
jgi:hypothetical protein